MAWSRYHKSRFLSSFLLWFSVLLISSYLLLFILVRYLFVKPNAEVFGGVVMMLNESVAQVAEGQGAPGIAALNARSAKRSDSFQVLPTNPVTQELTVWYPGLRIAQSYISEKSGGDTTLRFSDGENLILWLFDKRYPDLATRLEHKGAPFAKTFPILSLAVILLTCTIAAWLIARRLTNPLWDLAEKAKELATNKDLAEIKFDEKKSLPEIVQLTHALNQMRAELNRTIQDRENLLAAVTHDLRTPLSRLQIALDILTASNPGATPALLEDVGEMRRIIDQFVELGKLNEEIVEPWVEGDLNIFVGRIRDQYRRAGVNLRTQLPEQAVVVKYKAIGLTRLLYNLVDNACRHGDGNVQITVIQAQDGPILTVSNKLQGNDQGTGLTQALAEQAGHLPITGLGLRIVRQFAEVHNAQLDESTTNDIKTFSLRFKPETNQSSND